MTQDYTVRVPEGTFFLAFLLRDGGRGFLVSHARALMASVADVQSVRPFTIDSHVTLPDRHLAIWTLPPEDADFAGRWAAIRAGFAERIGAPGGGAGIWRPRVMAFAIRGPADLDRHRRICRDAPVDLGLVGDACDWRHGSFFSPRGAIRAA